MFYKNSTAKLNYCKCTLELSRKSLDIKIGAPGKSILTPSDNLKKWLWNFTKNRGKNLKSVIHDSHMKNLHVLKVVPPARFERAAPGLGILRSIQLSYGGNGVNRRTFYTNSYDCASTRLLQLKKGLAAIFF